MSNNSLNPLSSVNNDDNDNSAGDSSQHHRDHSMFEDDGDDVQYMTEDGFEIPPEWQTSCLMMLDLQHQVALENDRKKKNPEQAAIEKEKPAFTKSKSSTSPLVDLEQLFANLEKMTADAAAEMLAEQKQQRERQQGEKDEEEEEEDQEYYENDWENDDEMYDGMVRSESAAGMAREETDKDQWKLEEIIMRKSVPVQRQEDDYEYDEVSTRNQKREFSYLCKWAPNGRYTTWELRSLLVEEGFKPQVDAYDEKISKKGITHKQARYDFKLPCQYPSKAGVYKPRPKQAKLPTPPPKPVYKPPQITLKPLEEHQMFFERLFPNALTFIRKEFESISTGVTIVRRIINIAPEEQARKLMNLMRSKNYKVELLFHGTGCTAIAPIMKQGLLVPGKDGNNLRVANGSVHGVAVYCSCTASYSMGYCRGTTQMFVCVGVDEPFTHATHTIRTFTDEAYVCPVWLIEFESVPNLLYPIMMTTLQAVAEIKKQMREIPTYRYYDFREFCSALPRPDLFEDLQADLTKEVEKEQVRQTAIAEQAAANVKRQPYKLVRKNNRMLQRVLNIRAGVPIEDA